LTRAFWLKSTEVSRGEWRVLMGAPPGEGDDLQPVTQVSWYDALAYCNALSESESLPACYDLSGCQGRPGEAAYTCPVSLPFPHDCLGYRLPTEAEWEYAARAGGMSALVNGELTAQGCERDPGLDEVGWYCGNTSRLREVGVKSISPWGLYDMHGSVWEWVWDRYAPYPEGAQDPVTTSGRGARVFRGGAWDFMAEDARSARRGWGEPVLRTKSLGFRPARSVGD